MSTRDLPLDLVYPNPNQPRKIFARAELEELAATIAKHGLLQAICVRPDGAGRFMIIAGERRWRAHGLLGLPSIRAEVVDLTDDQLADAAIIENLQRKDITPLEEARAFKARLDAGLTVEDLAARLGLKQPWRITLRVQLLQLVPEYQDALARGILTPSQAQEMSKLTPLRQRLVFDAIGAGKCKTYLELYRVVQAHQAAEAQKDLFAAPPVDAAAARSRAEALLARVEAMAAALAKPFTSAEVGVLAGTTDGRAGVLAQKLEIMERAVKSLRLELAAAGAVRAA